MWPPYWTERQRGFHRRRKGRWLSVEEAAQRVWGVCLLDSSSHGPGIRPLGLPHSGQGEEHSCHCARWPSGWAESRGLPGAPRGGRSGLHLRRRLALFSFLQQGLGGGMCAWVQVSVLDGGALGGPAGALLPGTCREARVQAPTSPPPGSPAGRGRGGGTCGGGVENGSQTHRQMEAISSHVGGAERPPHKTGPQSHTRPRCCLVFVYLKVQGRGELF